MKIVQKHDFLYHLYNTVLPLYVFYTNFAQKYTTCQHHYSTFRT